MENRMKEFEGKRILITGGTGSLGKVLVKRLLGEEMGRPEEVIVFSRDEAKQHFMRLSYQHVRVATDEVIYRNHGRLKFQIGDIRDYASVSRALSGVDIVFSAAALKQVPTCEYFPYEAVRTNIEGPQNVVRAIHEQGRPVRTLVGISTDKAVKPVNVMGMTKAIQERVYQAANLLIPDTRTICVRYGNVMASRGSVIPLFHEQIRKGGPLTLTDPAMTRFLLTLNDAVDVIFAAVRDARSGETYIPRIPSARVIDVANALIGDRKITISVTGVRPGEKVHEVLISEEEAHRTHDRGKYYAISSILPEINKSETPAQAALVGEYSSGAELLNVSEVRAMLEKNHLLLENVESETDGELLK